MSLAIAKAILSSHGDSKKLREYAIKYMQEFGRKYPNASYGGRFMGWIVSDKDRFLLGCSGRCREAER